MSQPTILGRNPTYFMAAIQIGIVGLVAFGLNLTGLQVGVLAMFSAAILSLIANSLVTPVAFPSLPQGTNVEVVTPAGQPNQSVTL